MNSVNKVGILLLVCSMLQTASFAQSARVTVNADQVENKLTNLIYGSNIEDVNHEIYGGFYDQRVFGESFEEPATGLDFSVWRRYTGFWSGRNGIVSITPGFKTTSDVVMHGVHPIAVEPDHSARLIYEAGIYSDASIQGEMRFTARGQSGGLLVRVGNAGIGNDAFDGYEISLGADGETVTLGKHVQNFKLLKTAKVKFNPTEWNLIKVDFKGSSIIVGLNGKPVFSYQDDKNPLLKGKIGLRTWKSALEFRNILLKENGKSKLLRLVTTETERVSYNWDLLREKNAEAIFDLDTTSGYNGKNAQVISYLHGSGKAGIANRGLNRWGIATQKGQIFQGRIYLKGEQITGPVTVALESSNGNKTYASTRLNGITGDWKKHQFTLSSNTKDHNAKLTITMASRGKLWVDQVVLTGSGKDQFSGLPVRTDIGNMIVSQGVTFLRYAGTMVNSPEYKFMNMIGDPDKRPPYRGHWNRYSTNGFGIEEFLQFCEAANITPCFAVNIYETAEDMADMVEYLNGDVATKWGALRAKNGHTKPYGVKYIEIGNEEVLFNGDKKEAYQEYVTRYKLLQKAMKQKDSTLSLINAAWWRPASPNMEYVFKELNKVADYWDLHVGGDNPDEGIQTDKKLTEMLQKFKQWDPDTKMKIAVFEENGSKHGMQRALGHATNLNAIRKHNENVLTSSPANALQPYLQNDNDWDQGQIFFTPNQVWGMPPFYSQKMQAENYQPLRVYSKADSTLDVTATRSEDGKTLVLHIVNTLAQERSTTIELLNFEGRKEEAEAFTLSGELNAVNMPDKPKQHETVTSKVVLPGKLPVYQILPLSYTILKFTR